MERDKAPPRLAWLGRVLAHLPHAADVLEIGCGAGIRVARTIGDAGHRLLGVDLSAARIALAGQNVPGGPFVVGDAAAMPHLPESFDAVVALYCVTHIPRDRHAALFRDIRVWLRPGGAFLTCLSVAESPGWLEEDFLGLGSSNWTNGFDANTNRALVASASLSVERAEIVETTGPSGTERFLWLLARR